ncbi:MAG: ATP-grasp domain-containing protein [Chlorobiaceae bacterium]|nr:ATP-grasp domain-containing protein [Chlorobiaceae bacterium]
MIRLRHLFTFYGPSPFAAEPVVIAGIGLPRSEKAGTESALRNGCNRLQEAFPDWISRPPSSSLPIAERAGGTLAQWALGALNETRGYLHESGSSPLPDGALIWLGFHNPVLSILALELGVDLLKKSAGDEASFHLKAEQGLKSLWKLCRKHHPDYQAQLLMQGARSKGVPFMQFIPETKYWMFGWGCRSKIFFESDTNDNGSLGNHIQQSKVMSKMVFRTLGYPTPPWKLCSNAEELSEAAVEVGWPCVLKPLYGSKGKGVTAGIRSIPELEAAFRHAEKLAGAPVMVEGFVEGNDYRLTVIGGKLVAATRRERPTVTGDGKSTIRQLITGVNIHRTENLPKSGYLCPIPVDDTLMLHLCREGMKLETVPAAGKVVTLRTNHNISTGGTAFDVSDLVHHDVRLMAESLAKTMGLSTTGIDYMSPDIGKSWTQGGALIEINSTPGIDVPITGGIDALEVALTVLGEHPGRIPFDLVVVEEAGLAGAAEKLMTMVLPEETGWTCGRETRIGGMCIRTEKEGPWPGIQALLRNRKVSEILAVCSAEEIMRSGMPADRVDRISLCGELPFIAEWTEVLEKHGDSIETFMDWDAWQLSTAPDRKGCIHHSVLLPLHLPPSTEES